MRSKINYYVPSSSNAEHDILRAFARVSDDSDESLRIVSALKKVQTRSLKYHNWTHVLWGVNFIQKMHTIQKQRDLATIAFAFHDLVYVPGSQANEDTSRLLAQDLLKRSFGFDLYSGTEYNMSVAERILNAIDCTKHGKVSEFKVLKSYVAQIVSDADLIGLAASPSVFLRNNQNLADELGVNHKDKNHMMKTSNFLKSLYDTDGSSIRTNIFYTEEGKKFEAAARHNIQNYIKQANKI